MSESKGTFPYQFEEAAREVEEEEVSSANECCRDREQRRRELLAERNALREELQNARRELADKDRQVGGPWAWWVTIVSQ